MNHKNSSAMKLHFYIQKEKNWQENNKKRRQIAR